MIRENILKKLTDKDDKAAYAFSRQMAAESDESDKYLEMIPAFAQMLGGESSYVRSRAFMLICKQARWAKNGQIERVFNQMIPLLNDKKPTVVRQCLNALHEVVSFRPEMTDKIESAVNGIDVNRYDDSMSPLIEKDIATLSELMHKKKQT